MEDKSEFYYSRAAWFLKLAFIFLIVTVAVRFLFDDPSWQAWQWHYVPEMIALFILGVSASFGARAYGLGYMLRVVVGGAVIFIPTILIAHSIWFKTAISILYAVNYVWLSSPVFVGFVVGWKYGSHNIGGAGA